MDYKTKLKTSLKTIFGCNNYLNELQEQAVESIIERKRDIFVRGHGKSLCYQLPVMVKDNFFIIVITSRVSYMKKYTNYFTSKQITTNYLTANTCRRQKNLIENDIISKKSKMKILFITPLQYETAYFKTILKKIDKQRLLGIVIDQADNILSKQENLCNQYQNLDLKIIRVPIITITSKATTKVQKDIIKNFHLLNPKVYAMPVLRTNLYCDIEFINIMSDPMSHLTNFIKICLSMDSYTNSKKEENWGLIVCKDLETTTSVADFLISKGISALSSSTCSNQGKRSKNTSLKNVKDVKVITICEKNDTLSLTNSLVQLMAQNSVKFIVYWQVLPNIEKYYLLTSRAQFSFCRVYCEVDKVINNWMKSSCHNDINNELSTVILSSLKKLQCRHKAYSNFFGDIFAACRNRCDVCTEKEIVKKKIMLLMRIIDKLNLREKLQQILLEFPKDSNKICDENLQYKCSQKKVSSHKTESNVNVRVDKENRDDDHSSLDKNLAYNNEVICENQVKIDKKTKALSDLSDIYESSWKKLRCQASTSTATQSSNVRTLNRIVKVNVETFETCQRVIAIDHKYCRGKSLSSRDRREIDSNEIRIGKESSSSKAFYFNNEQHKSGKSPPATQSSNVRTVSEIIKINVETSETCQRVIAIDHKYCRGKSLCRRDESEKKTIEASIISDDEITENQFSFDDDIIILKEVNTSIKRRHCSTVKNQNSFERAKRRKCIA